MILTVLLAVRDPATQRRYRKILARADTVVTVAPSETALLKELNRGDIDLVVIHRDRLPANPKEWITSLRELPERTEVVVSAAREDPDQRAALLAAGCLAMLNENLPDPVLREALLALLERRRRDAAAALEEAHPRLPSQLQDFASESETMRQFLAVAERVVAFDSSLLLLGETGVGKEHLARAIHRAGARSQATFLSVNCAALPETLLESELFGHERGAFTGAIRTRKGYFELAHGGTIFLDEIAELPLHLQVKLLRVLDEHKIMRIGGEKSIAVDVRIMAATNRDLDQEVAARRFRSDLYFRLAVVTLELPPLRERREDIPPLIQSYLQHFSSVLGRAPLAMTPRAITALVEYGWPGNVRELINVVERAAILVRGDTIDLSDLPNAIAAPSWRRAGNKPGLSRTEVLKELGELWQDETLPAARSEIVAGFERAYLARKLEAARGRVGEAAEMVGINVRSLYNLMRTHGLTKERFKRGPHDV